MPVPHTPPWEGLHDYVERRCPEVGSAYLALNTRNEMYEKDIVSTVQVDINY